MGILCDRQIEREVGITPFDKGEKKDGKISSGLTSYGYDARVGYKFRVFKPYPAESIDPKNFNPAMLEDVDLTPVHRWEERNPGVFHCQACHVNANVPGKVECDRRPCHGVRSYILIPPHSFVLAETVETFTIPRDVLCVVVGKSTLARCGLIVNCTPLEPEWTGKVTVELSNTTPLPMRVYAGEGIMQCLFFRSDGHRQVLAEILQDKILPRDYPYTITAAMTGNSPAPMTCRTSYADKKGRYQSQTGLTLPTVDKHQHTWIPGEEEGEPCWRCRCGAIEFSNPEPK
jgi:dCTP deaminase